MSTKVKYDKWETLNCTFFYFLEHVELKKSIDSTQIQIIFYLIVEYNLTFFIHFCAIIYNKYIESFIYVKTIMKMYICHVKVYTAFKGIYGRYLKVYMTGIKRYIQHVF
jgi:hypothetical protein